MSDYENKVVRGYRLDVTIGAGGFGTVYHAYQEVLNREVAVKVIKEKYVNDPQFVRQFEAEARIIGSLEHFNIVTLYDYWRDPGGAYLVMRWLRGGSLRSYLKQSRLEIPQVVRVINQTAAALNFAHQHNVIHRDIKPENILLDDEGNAFLTDFGIAVDLRNQDNISVENISFGSPDYVAPEQLKDKIISPRSDIYSLGIMLYELLASRRPFVSEDPKEIMKMQLYNPVPSLRLNRPDLPPEIDTVIWQSTAKNPAHRYDNVLELAIAFQNIARKMEAVPENYIIATQNHSRVAPRNIPRGVADIVTDADAMATGVFDDPMATGVLDDPMATDVFDDPMATGVLPEFGSATSAYDDRETLQDSLPTNILPDDDTELMDPAQGEYDLHTPVQPDAGSLDSDDYNLNTPVQPYPDDFASIYDSEMVGADTNQFSDIVNLMTLTIEGEGPPNPYKGLRAFEESDAGSFFGREEIVARLVSDFADNEARFLALIGPSGSGKSSVVRAGMIPAFRRGAVEGSKEWFYSTMIPGDDPIRELSEAILRVAMIAPENWGDDLRKTPQGLHKLLNLILPDDDSELLLFIDQFEEVFTLTDNEEDREFFLNSVWYAVNQKDSRLRLIITLRADFYDRPLHYAQFGQMLKEHTEVVLPLNLQELESAILGPAGRVGLLVEPALKNAILNDVHNQPGALPLLQYALTELYERKPANQPSLTYDHYLKIGGIEGALAQRAQDIYLNELNSDEQNLARKLFLRIIAIDENGTVTRRRMLWSEMMSGIEKQDTLEKVLNCYSRHRLLTLDRDQVTRSPTIEVAHEALIKGWEQLGQWIEQNRVALQKRQELRVEVDRWIGNNRDKSYLPSGTRLGEFEGLIGNDLLALRQEEMDFITDGVSAREADERRKQFVNNAFRVFSVVTTVLFVIALIAFWSANNARSDAVDARNDAIDQAELARSRELAASSLANMDQNDLSLLLAIEAMAIDRTYEARNSLMLALQENPLVTEFYPGQEGGVRSVAFDSTGTIAVSGGLSGADNTIVRRNIETGEIIGDPLTGHTSWINDIAISPDNRLIASASTDTTIRLWDFESGEAIGDPLTGHSDVVRAIDFSPDSRHLASAGDDGKIIFWNVETGTIDFEVEGSSVVGNGSGVIFDLDYNNDGSRLAIGGDDNILRILDTETGEIIHEITGHQNWIRTVQFDPAGAAILSGDVDGFLFFHDANSGATLANPINTGHAGGITDLSFSLDSAFLATSGEDGRIIIWLLNQRGAIIAQIDAHRGTINQVEFSPVNYSLMSAGDDGKLVLSILSAVERPGNLLFETNQTISQFEFDQSHSRIVLAGESPGKISSTIQVLSVENAIELLYELDIATISRGNDSASFVVTDLALHPTGTTAAVALATGEVVVWDMNTGETLWQRNEHEAIPKAIAYTPDGTRIITAAENGAVLIQDAQTGDLIETNLVAPDSGVVSMAISPDGQTIAIGGRREILLQNLENETVIGDALVEHDNAIEALIFTADSTTLFSGSRDRSIIQWSATTGEFIQRYEGHTDWVLSLAISPDDQSLMSGSRNGAVRLWDIASGRSIGNAIGGPAGWLTDIHFVNDTLVYGSNQDNRVILQWTFDFDALIEMACNISNRNLTEREQTQFLRDAGYSPTCG